MYKKHIIATGAALLLCSTGAFADPFTFDPTGVAGASGNITNVGSFDQAPGNALSVGGGGVLSPGQQVTVLYQANLSTANAATTTAPSVFANGDGGKYFTFVAGYSEIVTNGGANFAIFDFNSAGSVNFFKMYATTSAGDNLTGAGFTSSTVILSGHFISTGFASSYVRSGTGTEKFDQFGGDDYSNFQSITGAGSTSLTAVIDSFDTNYFPDLIAGSTFGFINTSQVTPFKQVDPSRAFIDSTGTTSAATAAGLGPTNGGVGSGPNFQLQADANTSFVRAVPEPDSVALFGLGLGLVGLFAKRRARKQA